MGLFRAPWRKHRDDRDPASPASLVTPADGRLPSPAADEGSSFACREAAYERLGDVQRAYLMRWLVDPALTREVITGRGPSSAAKNLVKQAVDGLTDAAVLRELIALTDDDALKVAALEKLGSPLPDEELEAIAAETAERLLRGVLAGRVHPTIDLLHRLRGAEKWVPGLERVLDDEAYAPALLEVLSFLRGKTDRSDWQRFVKKNASGISRVLKRVFDEVTSPMALLPVVYTCDYLLLAWHACANESHVDMLAQHMQRYGQYREWDGSPLHSEHVLKDIYDHGFLQESIRRYSGTLLYKGGSIELGTGDDTYRDIWEDTYFLV